jgi:uncharacterized membrane protein
MAINERRQLDDWTPQRLQDDKDERIANGLGWFSIGLGLAEVVAPGRVANLIGVRDDNGTRSLLRFYGMRELAAGVGILSQPRPAGWMWGRVAGDMLDLASLVSAMTERANDKGRVATATAAVLGVTALDVMCAQQLSRSAGQNGMSRRIAGPNGKSRKGAVHVTKTTTINKPVAEVYRFWRDFENMPRFMSHLESVRVTGDKHSHWKAKAPAGMTVEWDAEITEDQPDSRIAWRSLEGSDVPNVGEVKFERAPGDRGAVVRVELEYTPPGGVLTSYVAKLFGEEPGQQIEDDLRRLKQILEIGEVVQSDASIHRGMHPAQPPAQVPAMIP